MCGATLGQWGEGLMEKCFPFPLWFGVAIYKVLQTLVAQLMKLQETPGQFLSWEDLLEKW